MGKGSPGLKVSHDPTAYRGHVGMGGDCVCVLDDNSGECGWNTTSHLMVGKEETETGIYSPHGTVLLN